MPSAVILNYYVAGIKNRYENHLEYRKVKNILITTEEFMIKDFPEDFNVLKNYYGRKLSEQEAGDLIQRHKLTGMIADKE